MKNSALLFLGLLAFFLLATHAQAAPWEVLSDVRYIKKGGVKAVRIDFALPVHYESHFPARRGKVITINLRFNLTEDEDISQLPLLQTLLGPEAGNIPLEDVTYVTEKGLPKLIVRFKETVNFSVSQVMGITNLVIFLPEKVRIKETDPVVDPIIQEFIPLSEGTADETLARKMVDKGRKALKNGNNLSAIQIFTKLLSMPQHSYKPISLELLGVGRERNNQAAQAKAVYENYLEKYPTGQDSVRVKQRLADLIAAQMRPKKRLKRSKVSKRAKKGYESQFDGYWSQYYYFSQFVPEDKDTSKSVDTSTLSNAISLDWRVRAADYDVRSRFDFNYDYDFSADNGKQTDGLEVSKAYTKLKNSRKGIFVTVGRHSANTAGGFGRVDGTSVGFNLTSKIRGDIVGGYLVNSSDKTHVQTNKPILGLGVDYNKIWRSLNVGPYFKMQKTDTYLETQVVGTDFSYFDKKLNVFGIVDYDISYTGLNIVMTRAAYNINKMVGITGRFDYRARNLYQTSNALICDREYNRGVETLGEYINVLESVVDGTHPNWTSQKAADINAQGGAEGYARFQAEQCTGNSNTFELGAKFKFSNRRNLNLIASTTKYNRKFTVQDINSTLPPVTPAPEPVYIAGSSTERQYNFSVQFITRSTFMKRDTFLIDGRFTFIENTPFVDPDELNPVVGDELSSISSVSINYRTIFEKDWRLNIRMQVRRKVDNKPERDTRVTTSLLPSFKMTYRGLKKINLYSEFGINRQRFSPQGARSDDYATQYFNFGFDWNF